MRGGRHGGDDKSVGVLGRLMKTKFKKKKKNFFLDTGAKKKNSKL